MQFIRNYSIHITNHTYITTRLVINGCWMPAPHQRSKHSHVCCYTALYCMHTTVLALKWRFLLNRHRRFLPFSDHHFAVFADRLLSLSTTFRCKLTKLGDILENVARRADIQFKIAMGAVSHLCRHCREFVLRLS